MAAKEDIAEFLLQKGYLLTALEFYQELLEDDGTELESLKEYFTKQPNFETESPRFKNRRRVSDADSLFQHHINNANVNNDLLEKLREKDEKVSLLEYELRRAREDITNLRVQLTSIVKKPQLPTHSSSSSLTISSDGDDAVLQLQRFQRERIREHEVKILNYLIKNYLVQNKYSLTAITFSEEMAEELTTWESVGLDTPEPPPLLSLYRLFFDNEEGGVQGALAKSILETSKLKKEIADKEVEFRLVKKKVLQYQKDIDQLHSKIKEQEITIDELRTTRSITPPLNGSSSGSSGSGSSGDTQSSLLSLSSSQQGVRTTPHLQPLLVNEGAATTLSRPSPMPTAIALAPPQSSVPPTVLLSSPSPLPQCPMQAAYKNIVRRKHSLAISSRAATEMGPPLHPSPSVPSSLPSPPDDPSSRIAMEISKIGALEGDQQVVCIVADCLPHIVPGVLLSKREELIPVILVAISQHPSNTERFALTKLLFNLIKKPNELQRQVIISGCIALASLIGPQRTEKELLSQCLDQIGDKHAERRILVADACGQLAPYVPPEQKLLLIFPILQQMTDDKNPLVRVAVARNVALLVSTFDNDEKYAQLAELFLRLLVDTDASVSLATRSMLLPAMIQWSDLIDAFHSKFLNMLLSELQSIIAKSEADDPLLLCLLFVIPHMKEVVFASNPAITAKDATTYETQSMANLVSTASLSPTIAREVNSVPTTETQENSTFKSVSSTSSVNSLHSSNTIVATNLCLLSDKAAAKLKTAFDMFISTQPEGCINTKDWPILDWIINEFLPRLLNIITTIPPSHHSLVTSLVEVVSSLCRNFGVPFTKKVVKNAFLSEMLQSDESDMPNEVNSKRLLLLPVYLSGVLTSLDEAEIIKYLHELIVNISVEENGWGHHHLPVLKEVVGQLCVQTNFKPYTILDTLCDMVAHPSNQVRLCIVTLFNVVIPATVPAGIEEKILPALMTLSNDPDAFVRAECVEPLVSLIVESSSDDALDKLTGAFDKIMESDSHQTQMAVVHGLTTIIPHLTFKHQFRDFYILPLLVEHAQKNSINKNSENRKQMANALFEAFRAFASVSLSREIIEDQVLPGLKSLISESGGIQVDPSFKTMVQSMIQDMKNINTITEKATISKLSPNNNSQNVAMNQNNINFNNNSTSFSDTNNTSSTISTNNTDKSNTTRKNIFEKLDAAASMTASITSSLKVDFDKAIPKWTWKHK